MTLEFAPSDLAEIWARQIMPKGCSVVELCNDAVRETDNKLRNLPVISASAGGSLPPPADLAHHLMSGQAPTSDILADRMRAIIREALQRQCQDLVEKNDHKGQGCTERMRSHLCLASVRGLAACSSVLADEMRQQISTFPNSLSAWLKQILP